MTVQELIDELKKFDPEHEVEAECSQCGYCTTLGDVSPKGRVYQHTVLIS